MNFEVMPKFMELPLVGRVHGALVICTTVTLLLCLFCLAVFLLVKYRFRDQPGRFQFLIESGIEGIRGYSRGQAGQKAGDELAPHVLAVALFIFANCLSEYFAVEPPTSDLSLTLTLGLVTLVVINFMGFRHRGFKGRLRHYIEPTPIVAPFKLIADLAIPISMGCRLYGNVLAGVIVMGLLYAVVPLAIPAALSIYFTLFHAVIQSYVFITLTLSFVRESVE